MQLMFDSAGHRITVGWRKATPACHTVKLVSLPSYRIDSPRSTLLCESHVEQVISERRTFAADHRTSTVSSSKDFWILEDMNSSGRSGNHPLPLIIKVLFQVLPRSLINICKSKLKPRADDEADKPEGSRRLAGLIIDRVKSVGLSDSIKFEAEIIKRGGKKNIFKQEFRVGEGETLLKASHCYLSTEAGPVPGLLFVSAGRVAFCSQRSITSRIPGGLLYKKIEIPIRNIREPILNDPQQKNTIILTTENSEFQFTDFLRYNKAFQNLQTAILWQILPSEKMQFMFDSAGHGIAAGWLHMKGGKLYLSQSRNKSHVEQVIERQTFAADHWTSTVSSSKAFSILEDMARGGGLWCSGCRFLRFRLNIKEKMKSHIDVCALKTFQQAHEKLITNLCVTQMTISRFISRPCFDQYLGSSSSTDHQGADDEADKPGGSRRLAGLIIDRVRSVGLSDSMKFEAKKIKKGGKKNIFKQQFQVREGEKLLKASRCCLSTEAGPVAGLLFISTERVAFCSQRSITSRFPGGLPDKKIEIPTWNIRKTSLNDPQQKNMIILTTENSEFQFTDFLRYDKTCQNLQAAILWQNLCDKMPISKFVSSPCFDCVESSSSTDHQGADDEADKPGGSRKLAGLIIDRVRSAGLSDSMKFEAKKIKEGGKKSIFKQKFRVREGEKLLKASHCCLSTEAGPVAGLLFISTERVAFCSQRSITSRFLGGLSIETDKKIEIPIWHIRETSPNDPQKKNMIIHTTYNSEFQFMNFLRYDKAYQNLQEAIRRQSLTS
ncbi:hypothetical protein SADUNF_Sadunf04G0047600 [Salix dunnii]|uniref:GRAM domain-containing protein n=1 Tax=Salix dunnii TaxID=1413687 RepID=A0A835KAM6_9ROSI|nr:hypothetical protein SADUNF_Sadunf04G0047600 [Salix dunnii]